MRTLYLLRHAKSSWADPGLVDHERPLAPRGIRDAKRLAKHLRRSGVAPALVLCSTARRTQETLELVRPSLGTAVVQLEDGLYGAAAEQLLSRIRAVPDEVEAVLLVGHNPAVQDLTLLLAAEGARLADIRAKLPTGALATLETSAASWSALDENGARLVDYVVPKELGDSA
ncbi:MAG TPA: histidine phosphatase family protein [Gaiellaceae bacterium]|jgi:phosphohistidine phosphatase